MKKVLSFVLVALFLMMPLTVLAEGDVYQISQKLTYTNADTVLPYRLILPDNYDSTKNYPMVLFLHGAGERGNDNELQLFHCVQYIYDNVPEDCIIVAPQCPAGQQWVDTPWANGSYSVTDVPESNELKAVVELIDQLKDTYSIDSDRVYATGISMGGFGTWNLMMRHNDVFAAAIPVCGGADPSMAEVVMYTPIFTFHGDADPVVPVSGTREMVKAIKDAGGTLIEYIEYPGAEHGIWNDAFATEGLLEKLFACKLSDRVPGQIPPVPNENNIALNAKYVTSGLAKLNEDHTAHDETRPENYPDENGVSLTDGVIVTDLIDGIMDTAWAGFHSLTPGFTDRYNWHYINIDLGKEYDITQFTLYACLSSKAGVSLPNSVYFCYSNDATAMENDLEGWIYCEPDFVAPNTESNKLCHELTLIPNAPVTARYVQVRIAAWSGGWSFVSEVEVIGTEHKEDNVTPNPDPDPDPNPDPDPDPTPDPVTVLGDVNNSGAIDMMDYILLKRNYFGTFTFDETQLKVGDVNHSDAIDMMDYILLKRAYFGTFTLA